MIMPGVARPWSASSAAMTEKAVPDEDGARVVAAPAHDRQRERRGGGEDGAEADAPEVDAAAGHRLVPADQEENGGGKGDAGRANSDCGRGLPPQHRSHRTLYRPNRASS